MRTGNTRQPIIAAKYWLTCAKPWHPPGVSLRRAVCAGACQLTVRCWHCIAPLPQVQGILDRTATGGMDWRNCCVYKITEEGGALVQPEVSRSEHGLRSLLLLACLSATLNQGAQQQPPVPRGRLLCPACLCHLPIHPLCVCAVCVRAAALPRQLHRCLLRCPSYRRRRHRQRLPRAVSGAAAATCSWPAAGLLQAGTAVIPFLTHMPPHPPPTTSPHPLAPPRLQGPPLCGLAGAVRQRRPLHGSSPHVCAAAGGGRAQPGLKRPPRIRQVCGCVGVGGCRRWVCFCSRRQLSLPNFAAATACALGAGQH